MLMLMKMMIAGMLTEDSSGSHLRVIDNAEKTTKQGGTEMRTNRCVVQGVMYLHMTGREVFQVCLRS